MTADLLPHLCGFVAVAFGVSGRGLVPTILRRTSARPHVLAVNGIPRTYLLYAPKNLPVGQRVPLVLMFHGSGNLAGHMPGLTGFDQYSETEHFMVCYPQGLRRQWNDGRGRSSADDVGFVGALVDELQRAYPVDSRRVYAAGISNGAFFANRLACQLGNRIAAIACVGGTMAEPLLAHCHPARPISVLYISGSQDPLVPIEGGKVGLRRGADHGRCVSLSDSIKFWCRENGIASPPAVEDIPDRVRDGTHIRLQSWSGGRDRTQVVAYVVFGGGHAWPGGPQYLPKFMIGRASQNLDATRAICAFFSQHSLP